jgi:hypothetical protein
MVKRQYVFLLSLAVAASAIVAGCKARKSTTDDECANFLVSYSKDVKPILDANCATTCHSAASKAAKIDLSNYETVKAISTEARFLGSVRHLAGFDAMPMKAPKLSDSALRVLNCWVKSGSPE